jgi:hypothetical protein
MSMDTTSMDSTRIIPDVSEVVVALFTDVKNAKDAICDLSRAGFGAPDINVAYGAASEGHAEVASTEHSVLWRLRERFEEDLYQHGASQMGGEAGNHRKSQASPYTEVDLRKALSEEGVPADRISLLESEIGAGVLVLVKSREHRDKAEEILERNNGTIRTDSALEAGDKRGE